MSPSSYLSQWRYHWLYHWLYLKYSVCQCGLLLMDWWARQVGERGKEHSTFIYILFLGHLDAFLWGLHIS